MNPEQTIRGQKIKTLSISVFNNEKGKSYTIKKGFKKNGEWINTNKLVLFPDDVVELKNLITQI